VYGRLGVFNASKRIGRGVVLILSLVFRSSFSLPFVHPPFLIHLLCDTTFVLLNCVSAFGKCFFFLFLLLMNSCLLFFLFGRLFVLFWIAELWNTNALLYLISHSIQQLIK